MGSSENFENNRNDNRRWRLTSLIPFFHTSEHFLKSEGGNMKVRRDVVPRLATTNCFVLFEESKRWDTVKNSGSLLNPFTTKRRFSVKRPSPNGRIVFVLVFFLLFSEQRSANLRKVEFLVSSVSILPKKKKRKWKVLLNCVFQHPREELTNVAWTVLTSLVCTQRFEWSASQNACIQLLLQHLWRVKLYHHLFTKWILFFCGCK